jgi:thiol-disulfide isomerase/thioredoxin
MVESLDGVPMDLASVIGKGKPVVLEFWATWCPLCKQLEPAMGAARAKYGDQVTFVSVGVSANQSPERQRAFAAAHGMTGMLLFDRHDLAVKAYSVPHTSYLVVLDGAGTVMYTGVGESQDVDAAVRKGLGGASR